jgi:hypothetical protein
MENEQRRKWLHRALLSDGDGYGDREMISG